MMQVLATTNVRSSENRRAANPRANSSGMNR